MTKMGEPHATRSHDAVDIGTPSPHITRIYKTLSSGRTELCEHFVQFEALEGSHLAAGVNGVRCTVV